MINGAFPTHESLHDLVEVEGVGDELVLQLVEVAGRMQLQEPIALHMRLRRWIHRQASHHHHNKHTRSQHISRY